MRILTMLTFVATAATAAGQQAIPKPNEVPNPAPRFNVLFNERFYQQGSPKLALAAVVKAAQLEQFDYIAAYLFDETAADAKIAAQAKTFEKAAESDLRKLRGIEKADPFRPAAANPLPVDPDAFLRRVAVEAEYRGFNKVVSEIRERFVEDPSHIRDLQYYLRNGEVTLAETTAKMTVPGDKGKAIYFKKIGTRWFVEDRTTEPVAASAPATGAVANDEKK